MKLSVRFGSGVPSRTRRRSRRFVALATLSLLGLGAPLLPVSSVRAQSVDLYQWKSVNVQGMGYVTGISISKTSPYDVYVRTDVGGAYRYDRTGEAWVSLFDKFDSDLSGGGIGVEAVMADPSNASRVYAAVNYGYATFVDTDGKTKYHYAGEVFSSTDKGVTWTPTGLATSSHALYVGPNSSYRTNTGERIGVDPNKGDLIYFASSRDGLWKKNGTGAWAQVTGGLPGPTTLPGYYANGQNGAPNDGFPGYTFVLFDKSSGTAGNASQKIYVGVFGSGVWQSTNGGTNWTKMTGSYVYPRRGAITTDGTLYVSGGIDANLKDGSGNGYASVGSVYRYKNSAWSEIRPADTTSDGGIYATVSADPNTAGTVVVARGPKVWRSTNYGDTWGSALTVTQSDGSLVGAPGYYNPTDANGGVAAVAIDPSNSGKVWWANGWGVTRTDNITAAPPVWTWRMKNLEELDANMLRVPPKTGGAALWTVAQDMIGFRHASADTVPSAKFNPNNVPTPPNYEWANGSWTVYPNPFPHVAGATGIDYCYTQPDYGAFVGMHQWQYQDYGPFQPVYGKTTDNGVTWNAFPSVPTENLYVSWAGLTKSIKATGGQIAVSPTNPNRMVWAPSTSTWPHYTTDGGQNWYLCYNLDHGPQPSPYDPNNNDHVHYQNLPQAWGNNITPWVDSYILAADRKDPNGLTFYYYDCFSFFYSTDGGANWHKSSASLPPWILRPAIVPNPLTQGDVWMTFARNSGDKTPNKLYRSQNGGQAFSIVSTVDSAEFIAFGKGPNATTPSLYLWGRVGGATKDAMYKSDNLGGTWTRILDPNAQQFPGITYMDADMRTANLVYVATTGRGFFYGSKTTASDTAKYNFESGTQGWAQSMGTVTTSVSTTQKYAGNSALAAAITASGAGDTMIRVLNAGANTPMPVGGQTVTFRVWIPSGAPITGIYAFAQDANWGWTGNGPATLTSGQWNTISLTVPTGAVTPLNALGVGFTLSASWSGTCYVDSVNW